MKKKMQLEDWLIKEIWSDLDSSQHSDWKLSLLGTYSWIIKNKNIQRFFGSIYYLYTYLYNMYASQQSDKIKVI